MDDHLVGVPEALFSEGRQEGRQEESVQLTLRLLRRRFGAPLISTHEQQIRRLSL